MTLNQIKILFAVFFSTLAFVSISSAQYYDPNYNYNNSYNYNSNYNTGYNYGNNPNNGVVSFTSDYNSGYNSGYDANYYNNNSYNYNSNYNYNNSYIPPISVSNSNYGYGYNYNGGCSNNNYNSNCGNYTTPIYNNIYLTPTTYAATNVSSTAGTINGNITMTGNYSYTSGGTAWFQYGTSQNSLNSSTNPANIYSNTSINAYLSGLTCGTTYYFRAVASGSNSGLQYGNTLSFRTANCNYAYNYNNYGNYNNQYYQYPQTPSYPPQNITTRCTYATKYKKYWR